MTSTDAILRNRSYKSGPTILGATVQWVAVGMLTLSVLGVPRAQESTLAAKSMHAKARPARLYLRFAGVEVHVVLDQIASYASTDILLTPGAKGLVSINLRNRTPEEAIKLVTAAAGLSAVRVGTAYIVGPAGEVATAAAKFGADRKSVV